MKRLIVIMGLLLIAAPVMGATPTPAPSPTPVPADVPSGAIVWPYTINLRASFTDFSTAAFTDHKLVNIRNGQAFTVPAGQRFYVTDLNWSCQSAVIAYLEFDGTYSDQIFDYVYFPFTGQGKVINYIRPITSLDAASSPVLTTDRGCTGFVFVNGYLE